YYEPSIYVAFTISLHDALPIFGAARGERDGARDFSARNLDVPVPQIGIALVGEFRIEPHDVAVVPVVIEEDREDVPVVGEDEIRSEEHTSELQSRANLVCRLLI